MERNNNWPEENPDIYRTGSTRPPKNHGGLVAVLLVVVIFFCGIATAIGYLKLQFFHDIERPDKTPPLAFSATSTESTEAAVPQPPSVKVDPHPNVKLDINTSPESMENIPQEGGLSLQEIYEKTIHSVVSISCQLDGGSSTGTGVVLSQDGYIVTNSHVVEGARNIQVLFTDEKILEASVVGVDVVSDLAVLYVKSNDLVPAQFGDSSSIRVGDLAVAIGDPLGLELRGTMTDGIISAINRDITTGGRTMTLLQTNAALNSGNSGGPLLNCYGQVIGINTMKIGDYMNSGGVEGLGFAIPSTTVKEVVDQLISQGYVTGRPYLGIIGQEISGLYQQLYRLPEGIFISKVDKHSEAYRVGIRPGDVLVSFDGVRVPTADDLNTQLYHHKAGDTVSLVIFRADKSYEISLTIGQAD